MMSASFVEWAVVGGLVSLASIGRGTPAVNSGVEVMTKAKRFADPQSGAEEIKKRQAK